MFYTPGRMTITVHAENHNFGHVLQKDFTQDFPLNQLFKVGNLMTMLTEYFQTAYIIHPTDKFLLESSLGDLASKSSEAVFSSMVASLTSKNHD